MSCHEAQTQRTRKRARAAKLLGAALLGLTALLTGCADDQAPTEEAAPELALLAEGMWVNSGLSQGIPDDAFHAGWEKSRQNLYFICRVETQFIKVPGKLYAGRCHIYDKGAELHYDEYQILVDPQRRLSWRDATSKRAANAVVAGSDRNGNPVWICQAEAEGSLIPGQLHETECITTYGNKYQRHPGQFRELVLN